jgi:hypothetical protein
VCRGPETPPHAAFLATVFEVVQHNMYHPSRYVRATRIGGIGRDLVVWTSPNGSGTWIFRNFVKIFRLSEEKELFLYFDHGPPPKYSRVEVRLGADSSLLC